MEIKQAIKERNSVRSYINKPIEEKIKNELNNYINECNKESGLNMQLITNEPTAFTSFLAKYGKFEGVTNYIAIVGDKKNKKLDEISGYYGEKVVLKAQQLGLNTCWVALTYKKNKDVIQIGNNEKVAIVIALGYGKTQGVKHKSKPIEQVMEVKAEKTPQWFLDGVESALLAPTSINQQKFLITLNEDYSVSIKAKLAPKSKIDLGIVKYHFEIGAELNNFNWL